VAKAKIRLTKERFKHITSSHPEITSMSEIVNVLKNPDLIIQGWKDELLVVKRDIRKRRWIVVVYKQDFVITAYITTDTKWLFKRKTIWKKES